MLTIQFALKMEELARQEQDYITELKRFGVIDEENLTLYIPTFFPQLKAPRTRNKPLGNSRKIVKNNGTSGMYYVIIPRWYGITTNISHSDNVVLKSICINDGDRLAIGNYGTVLPIIILAAGQIYSEIGLYIELTDDNDGSITFDGICFGEADGGTNRYCAYFYILPGNEASLSYSVSSSTVFMTPPSNTQSDNSELTEHIHTRMTNIVGKTKLVKAAR